MRQPLPILFLVLFFVSHPGVAGSYTYDHRFRLRCRVALDGKEGDIPVEGRSRVVCALVYEQYHGCSDGHYDFQLCWNARRATLKMGRLRTPDDYPSPPLFQVLCRVTIARCPFFFFLDDPVANQVGNS